MYTVNEEDLTPQAVGEKGELWHLVAPWVCDVSRYWLGVLVLAPGGSTVAKASEGREGCHYTISGTGLEVVGGVEIQTRPGTCIYIAPGEMHQVINTGEVPLKVLSLGSPPMPKPANL